MDHKLLIAVYTCHMLSPPSVACIKPIKIQVTCPFYLLTYGRVYNHNSTKFITGIFLNIKTCPQDSIQLAFDALCDQKQLFYYNTVLYKVLLKIKYPLYS